MSEERLGQSAGADDYNLQRFKDAQRRDFDGQAVALEEIRSGGKRSHWIWYILPQHGDLGRSARARYYGISCLDEAIAYLRDDELETNLYEICGAILDSPTDDPVTVMGSHIDAMKLKSSMTLFELAAAGLGRTGLVFSQILDRMFGGERDALTLSLVADERIAF